MPREAVQPKGVWDARPRFAQVMKIGNTIHVSGQTPVDAHGKVVGKGNIEVQARQVFENIQKCLAAAGATFDHVVKINLYCTDMETHYQTMSKIRCEYLSNQAVASTWVEVRRLVDPDWLLEVEAIAVLA